RPDRSPKVLRGAGSPSPRRGPCRCGTAAACSLGQVARSPHLVASKVPRLSHHPTYGPPRLASDVEAPRRSGFALVTPTLVITQCLGALFAPLTCRWRVGGMDPSPPVTFTRQRAPGVFRRPVCPAIGVGRGWGRDSPHYRGTGGMGRIGS